MEVSFFGLINTTRVAVEAIRDYPKRGVDPTSHLYRRPKRVSSLANPPEYRLH